MNNIEGIDCIRLKVSEWDSAQQFISDLGLVAENTETDVSTWRTLNNSKIILERADTNEVSEIHWGVTDQIKPFEVVDPNGVKLIFRPSGKTQVDLTAVETNGWNSINRINQAVPVYDHADTIEICHIVMLTTDIDKSEKFYTDLGFVVSDRLIGRGIFMRASVRSGHHDLFLIQSTENKLHHIAITVKDIYQVVAGGLNMASKGWLTEVGPGRHPISSSFFWYFKSPLGGMIEYTCNEDFLTEEWTPRDLEYTVGMTTEWAVHGGIDPQTKHQRK